MYVNINKHITFQNHDVEQGAKCFGTKGRNIAILTMSRTGTQNMVL